MSLEHVGDTLYIGFNDDLEKIVFPKLKTIGGALIIEGNGALASISLPALERITKYLHIHDHAVLMSVSLPRLRDVGGEFSVVGCPQLTSLKVGAGASPTRVQRVEVRGCAQEVYPTLHVRSARTTSDPR
jgi:hypothetical protein